ncbi:MAG: hypothetical protein H0W83_10215 [Planctomycetes bacterium]|nr:hypothetical protein [Planctomycetota bacterium]
MFPSPLPALQALAPLPEPRLSVADLSDWDPGVAVVLQGLGFLVGHGLACNAVCASCGAVHRFERLPNKPALFAAGCPDAGLVTRAAECLQDWTIAHASLATWIGAQMGASGDPQEVLPGQAWRWDRVQFAGARRALIVVRSPPARTSADAWQRLGLVPRAMLLSFGIKPLVSDDQGPVAFTAPVWSYLEDEGGLRLLVEELAQDVAATEQDRAEPSRPVPDKRATRSRTLGLLHKELVSHIQSAKDALRQGEALLPKPEQQWLAKAVETSEATVSRCLTEDESAAGLALRRLWAIAEDEDAVRVFDPNATQ